MTLSFKLCTITYDITCSPVHFSVWNQPGWTYSMTNLRRGKVFKRGPFTVTQLACAPPRSGRLRGGSHCHIVRNNLEQLHPFIGQKLRKISADNCVSSQHTCVTASWASRNCGAALTAQLVPKCLLKHPTAWWRHRGPHKLHSGQFSPTMLATFTVSCSLRLRISLNRWGWPRRWECHP